MKSCGSILCVVVVSCMSARAGAGLKVALTPAPPSH